MRVWFTSDLHLGHRFVAGLRGFSDVDEHDALVLAGLAAVPAGDRLWVLGDLSGRHDDEARALDLIAEHAGHLELHLIPGNHDSCHPIHKSSFRMQRRFLEVFDSVQAFQTLRWQGRAVHLSHFPRPGQDHEGMVSRYDDVRLRTEYLVHGHLHSPEPVTGPGQVDVGVEAWGYRPAPQESVEKLLLG
ncbi:MAG: metallophosphoesterase family protein [Corynebacterium sp.]|uniref:metallophosphoesterase family protein n=1 Tax=Corynebacterium sp. TaxID=1720 RepID=UPI002707A7B7|nr:metallophosphoesterase family protein [Corynebacterium sp.]